MGRYRDEAGFRHDAALTTGVLLVNLGTPAAPDTAAVRRYLAEFLWDPRVVEIPRPLWWLILHSVVLRTRPARVAQLYRSIWSPEGSPLLAIARRQCERIGERLAADGAIVTGLAMRYGEPSIPDALDSLRAQGVTRILVLPLYPQYSATTTASVFDAVTAAAGRLRRVPELRFVHHYHDDPAYIDALAASVRETWQANGEPDRLLMSFHGLPQRCLAAGDPYYCEAQKTARLLAERLDLDIGSWQVAFQSRFGREQWLAPYVDQTLREWGAAGIGRVDVICPGFSADCLETLEEIAIQNRDTFLQAGGREYHYIPALNDRDDHIDALCGLIRRHLQGWDTAPDPDMEARLSRARALGADR
ncbi:MAG TPA: ferrochelatase [Gammaproteobacteria bacterium]|nr:ferrochelatase [Gammaproteobacteria bacterium]